MTISYDLRDYQWYRADHQRGLGVGPIYTFNSPALDSPKEILLVDVPPEVREFCSAMLFLHVPPNRSLTGMYTYSAFAAMCMGEPAVREYYDVYRDGTENTRAARTRLRMAQKILDRHGHELNHLVASLVLCTGRFTWFAINDLAGRPRLR
jgi:hypothetical protein